MPEPLKIIDISPIEKQAPFLASQNFAVDSMVATIFRVTIIVSGAIFMLLLLYAGVTYMTAAGNDDQVGKAKKVMTQALIGLIIVVTAYGIGIWVLNQLGIGRSVTSQVSQSSQSTETTGTTSGTKPGTTNPTNTTGSTGTGTTGSTPTKPGTSTGTTSPIPKPETSSIKVTYQAFNVTTGRPLSGVKLTVNGFHKVTSSNQASTFMVDKAGTYRIEASAPGFKTCTTSLMINKADTLRVRLASIPTSSTKACLITYGGTSASPILPAPAPAPTPNGY